MDVLDAIHSRRSVRAFLPDAVPDATLRAILEARGFGLHPCPQAAWAYHHDIVRRTLALPDDERVVCGIALGYENPAAPENALRTDREPVASFARFLG